MLLLIARRAFMRFLHSAGFFPECRLGGNPLLPLLLQQPVGPSRVAEMAQRSTTFFRDLEI